MTITLFLNSQTEADSPAAVFTDQWQTAPYAPDNMFCSGKSSARAEFILPEPYTFDTRGKKPVIRFGRELCLVTTGADGRPGIKIQGTADPGISLFPVPPQKTADTLPATPAAKHPHRKPAEPPEPAPQNNTVSRFVPRYINDQWEIY
jgi:hypothetical protein